MDPIAAQFEQQRPRLQAVAHRLLGSTAEAEDAVQEAWLRVTRSDTGAIDNLAGWLTTVVARVALDQLKARNRRREDPTGEPVVTIDVADPEQQAVMADSVGLALLVVLDALTPGERLAFVLHDMFAVPFREIAAILGTSPDAARQLASRARRRVRGAPVPDADLARQRELVDAFLAAARDGDFDALVRALDPDVVFRHGDEQVAGAPAVARTVLARRGYAAATRPAIVNGAAGLIATAGERLLAVTAITFRGGRIAAIDLITDPVRLR